MRDLVGLNSLIGLGTPLGGAVWNPLDGLGAQLLDEWDAENTAAFTLSGAAVTTHRSTKNAYSATQAVSASKPLYSATSFNNRPGVTLDGVDDDLTFAGVGIFPTAANPVEIWMLVDQLWDIAETAVKILLCYGGNTAATRRRMHRAVISAVNRFGITAGDGAVEPLRSNATGDFTGRHVIRGVFTGTEINPHIDGVGGGNGAAIPATGTLRFRIGATTSDTPGAHAKMVYNYIALTPLLSAADAALMLNYLKTRGGIA